MLGRSLNRYVASSLGNVAHSRCSFVNGCRLAQASSLSLSRNVCRVTSTKKIQNGSDLQTGLKAREPFIWSSTANVRHYSDANYPEHFKVNLPALSPTMEMGTIISWEKKEGDQVSEGDLLCEIETDKATMGFETPEEGYLAKIILPAGTKDVPIGRLLCIIAPNAGDVEKFKDYEPPKEAAVKEPEEKSSNVVPDEPIAPKMVPIKAPSSPAAAPSPTMSRAPPPPSSRIQGAPQPGPVRSLQAATAQTGSRPFASPAAKKLAAERGVDLFQIAAGSGMDGLITVKDVEGFAATVPVPGVPTYAAAAAAPPSSTAPIPPPGMRTAGGMPALQGESHTDAEISNMRKVIAKRLQSSKLEVPHYYLTVDIDMDELIKLRQDINSKNEKAGIKLSVNDFIIKATALACKHVPAVNSAWMDTFIREHHTCDVSVAVDTGNGLITPIVTSAETKGLAEISYTVREMAGRAKEGRLQPHEFQGGTITVSNLGMFGISHFTAIINSPQSCILAVGGTKLKVIPVGKDGSTKTVNVMSVTLSCDHRVVDGAVGAQWLQKFKGFLEQPTTMLL